MTKATLPGSGVEVGISSVAVACRDESEVAVITGEVTRGVAAQLTSNKQASKNAAMGVKNRRIFMELVLISK